VPLGSVILCVSLGSITDDLTTELLVRILRDQKIDARHLSIEDLKQPPPEAVPGSVSMIYVVSASPGDERKAADAVVVEIRARFAGALLVAVFMPGLALHQGPSGDTIATADRSARSLVDALQICLDWLEERTKA
jgi:hypothetical protein